MKFLAVFFLIISTSVFAEDSVKVLIGTQTYFCQITDQLSCQAANQVQQQQVLIKKDGAKLEITDDKYNLKATIETSLNQSKSVVYDFTLCSKESCTVSTATTDSAGTINHMMLGQYNITQKSFYVLGFFISNQAKGFEHQAETLLQKFHK